MPNINAISLFQGSRIKIHDSIYSNDAYPSCFLVSSSVTDYKVRLTSTFNPHAIVRERNALEYIKNHGHKLGADILEAKTDGAPESHYLVETFLPGKSLEKYTTNELEEHIPLLTHRLSSCLSEMHSIYDSEFHSFIGDRYQTYMDMLTTHILRHLHAIEAYDNNLSRHLFKVIEALKAHEDSMVDIIPTFLHFDLKPQNIIFDIETLNVGIVDFEHARFGDPFHELVRAKLKAAQNTLLFQKLWSQIEDTYLRKIGTIPIVRRLIYQIYYYVAELPYLFRINDTANITKIRGLIEKTLSDLNCYKN